MNKRKMVVLTGAGISAESGLQTFRGLNGLWEGHRVEDVASPEGFAKNPELVQEFYNIRRVDCRKAQPNAAHKALVELEDFFDVYIITQNIDDLHERAGSKNVLHLHGEIMKAQSTIVKDVVVELKNDTIKMGDLCPCGYQLRPNVVWFGEPVPNMLPAIDITKQADVFIVIGTSLQVYPAANLIYETNPNCDMYLIDPNAEEMRVSDRMTVIAKSACEAMPILLNTLTK